MGKFRTLAPGKILFLSALATGPWLPLKYFISIQNTHRIIVTLYLMPFFIPHLF